MRSSSKGLWLTILTFALVLGVASAAFADGVPTLVAGKTALVYPHSTYLLSTTTTPSAIWRRLAGSEDWVAWWPVASGVATTPVKPRSTAAYKVISDGVESEPVTITVAAQLSKPQINKSHGHKGHALTIKGWISPLHSADATVGVKFFRWQQVTVPAPTAKKGGKPKAHFDWVQVGDPVEAKLYRKNSNQSKWSLKWTPSAKGTWRVVVFHEDVAHVYSSASMKAVIKR